LGPTVAFWALELADHAVTGVRVRKTPEGALEVLEWWSSPVVEGENPVAAAVRQAHRRGIREHGLHLVLPGRGATCRSSRISPEDADLSPGELERDLYDFTPFEQEEAVLRWRRLGGAGVLDFRVVAERRAELGRVEQAFETAGCRFLGISLAPAAALGAREVLMPAVGRGYLLEIRGGWSASTAFDGALSVRYPIPFGLHDLRRRYEAAHPPAPFESALAAVPGAPGSDAAIRALAAAAEPLALDFRRAVDFHRAAVRGTGDEMLVLAGACADGPGLRAAVASFSSVAFAPPVPTGDGAPIRPGPRVRPEALAAALPLLFVPLGGALGAAGSAPRDLDFRNLPDDLPAARDRNLYPAAAALILLGAGASFLFAAATRDALARSGGAAPPPPAAGTISAAEARARAGEVRVLAGDALRRAALRRSLSLIGESFPRAGAAGVPAFGTEGIQVLSEEGGYRSRIRLRFAGEPRPDPAAEAERLAPVLGPLVKAGWRVVETTDGLAVLERVDPAGGT
jgi:hypothetical protein